tara:strand:- start:27748 stop:28725 length:978 start_codon:yes stop_codon:yes gene_type:complete
MGFLDTIGSILGKPKALDQNFGYDLQQSDYTANPNMLASINNLNSTAGRLGSLGGQFTQTYQDMLNPNSAMNQRQFGQLRNQIGDINAQTNRNMNQSLASRGMGNGGMANLLGAANLNRSGEQVRQGMGNILNQSLNAAQGFGNMAMGAYGQQAGAYGQAGQFGSQIDSRQLQNNQFNTDAQNTYEQYIRTANYNQDVQNQNAQGAWANSMLGLVGGLGSAALGNPAGLAGMFGGGGTSNLPAAGVTSMVSPMVGSDRNLKTNIELTGVSNSGINIYEFDYKDKIYGEGRYEGVMAQEVPNASVIDNGVLKVDYSKIDVNFRRIA